MNKFISSLAAVALLAMTVVVGPVEAAALTVISVDGASAGTNLTAAGDSRIRVLFTNTTSLPSGGTITLTFANGFDATGVVDTDVALTAAGGATVAGGGVALSSVGSGTNNRIVITTATAAIANGVAVTLDFNGPNKINAPAAGIYQTTINTSVSDFGATFAYVGTANQVSVSATVDPVISFSLNSNAISLGTLPTAANTYASGSVVSTVNSNAENSIVVTMASTGLKSATREIGVTDIAGVAQTAGTDYYKISTNATPSIADANGADMTTAAGTDIIASQTVYQVLAPVANGQVTVTVAARAAATTEAGNYTDTLTFVATPTF